MSTITIRTVKTRTNSEQFGQAARYHHIASDDGAGGIVDEFGEVVYATGVFILPVLPPVTETVWGDQDSGGSGASNWTSSSGGSELQTFAAGIVTCHYTPAAAGTTDISVTIAPPNTVIQLINANLDEAIVQGSVMFTCGTYTYFDREGVLYRYVTSTGLINSAENVGTVNYVAGNITILPSKISLSSAINIITLQTIFGKWTAIDANFRTQLSPLKPEALSVSAVTEDGVQITATADENGDIVSEWITGSVNYNNGTAKIAFGKIVNSVWDSRRVDPSSIRYNAVSYKYIPLSADILGIDAVRLPPDGRVPIYRTGDLVIIANTDETTPATKTNGQTINAGRTRLAWVRLLDDDGLTVPSDRYTLDRAAGTVTITNATGLAQPLTLRHTVADLRMVTDAQINGSLTLSRALSFDFPTTGTVIAGCLLHGDRRARVSAAWDQNSWDGTWKDSIVGSAATATLDLIAHPITVTNEGCETERWILRWTNTTNVELIGETRGLVFSGIFNTNIAPINPRTRDENGAGGVPYLTIPVAANGGGWSAGNVVRINTVGAIAPIWMARSIMQSDEPAGDGADGCEIYALGNIDRP